MMYSQVSPDISNDTLLVCYSEITLYTKHPSKISNSSYLNGMESWYST